MAATPHRLGTLASRPLGTAMVPRANRSAGRVAMAFTPGVDGDYAHPTTTLAVIAPSPAAPAALLTTALAINWTDSATGPDDDPVAMSAFVLHGQLDVARALASMGPAAGAAEPAVLLGGFALNMSCNPALQPPGEVCNSNGIWATHIAVEIDNGSVVLDRASGVLHFDLAFELGRAWTPDKGGGKPFNWRMTFDAVFDATIVLAAPAGGRVTPGARVELVSSLWAPSSAHSAAITGKPGVPAGEVGITGWGFSLVPQHANETSRLGRYFESIAFAVEKQVYAPTSGTASFAVQAHLTAPLTVHDVGVKAWMAPALVQLDGVSSGSTRVVGVVCEDVKLFSTDVVDFDVPVAAGKM
ncbi:uncharacterized protein AMSG_06422 [Thecamonas trahens ATCC 50062]|uniref:Uncharacterized protein n=1 Tax=Thecamonas trahens ATCC 50062 TaxID=461836 RepID=A0A0L0DFZ7_THETB|nr:hypothetical protein AMSG_06422 [Thecamonas trahens ATCC 50062]KNC50263.1 hypothetical protein AMSG_06422 [Thecamonas trahens ATCC 50062]|eukprot:XP_013757090.1 hypothetical protein AMSG_06422 [Thecamonas trahens ATCC 50062]